MKAYAVEGIMEKIGSTAGIFFFLHNKIDGVGLISCFQSIQI